MSMALPETKDEKIPDTLEEGEQGWFSKHFTNTYRAGLKSGLQVARIL